MDTKVKTLKDPRKIFTGPITTTSVEGPEGHLFAVRDAEGMRVIDDLVTFSQLRAWMRTLGLTF
jgi:hypothetical protein